MVVLGDVSGKGSPAALLMALLLAMLRTLAPDDLPPPALVERLNRLVYEQAPGTRFITLFLAIFDLQTGSFSYVNAGQTPPLLRRQDGSIEKLATGGIALGMFDASTYTQAETHLARDDLLVAYSDGITEAENQAGRPFDEDGLERAVHTYASSPAPDLARTLFTVVEQYVGDVKLVDDLTVVVVKRTNVEPPPSSNSGAGVQPCDAGACAAPAPAHFWLASLRVTFGTCASSPTPRPATRRRFFIIAARSTWRAAPSTSVT